MTALSKDRKTDNFDPDSAIPRLLSFPVEASTKIYGGSIVATNAAGNAVPASATTAIKVWGRCEKQADNSAGTAGAIQVQVRQGTFAFTNGSGADALSSANPGVLAYVIDDNTVGATSGGGTRQAAGIFYYLLPDGEALVGIPQPSLFQTNPDAAAGGGAGASAAVQVTARNVVPSNVASLSAFTVAGNDGITNVANDIVLLAAQTTGPQNGIYQVGTVTAGAAPLTRVAPLGAGGSFSASTIVLEISAGTVFANSEWKNTATGVVGTNDPAFYPAVVTQQVTLAAGISAVTNVPILSATKTQFVESRITAGGTVATTVAYNPTAITAGPLGTATATIQAQVAAGTIQNADTSTLNVSIINF
jgi:hypothetical protein